MIQTTDSKWNMVDELDENILCSPKKSYYDEKGFDNERLLGLDINYSFLEEASGRLIQAK